MAITKNNNFRVSRLESECSPPSRDYVWSDDEDEVNIHFSASDSDSDSDSECDVDSGAGSDDFDLSELGEVGAEFCQLSSQNFSMPFDLYDLPDLREILSLDTWNSCLTEDERYSLAEYLPDMDQETFVRTLKELFSCENFHFGSPLNELFFRLKGGLCEPRVALYQQGLNFLEKRKHYHLLHKYQDSMVNNLTQMKSVCEKYAGYNIEERLQILNVMRTQKGLMCVEAEGSETDLSSDGWLSKKMKSHTVSSKRMNQGLCASKPPVAQDLVQYGIANPKGVLKVAKRKSHSKNVSYVDKGFLKTKRRTSISQFDLPRQDQAVGFDLGNVPRFKGHFIDDDVGDDDDDAEHVYGMHSPKSRRDRVKMLKPGKKQEQAEHYMDYPFSAKNKDSYSYAKGVNGKPMMPIDDGSFDYHHQEGTRKIKQSDKLQKHKMDKWSYPPKMKRNPSEWSMTSQPDQQDHMQEDVLSMDPYVKSEDRAVKSRKWKSVTMASGHKTQKSKEKIATKYTQNGGQNMKHFRYPDHVAPSEETESDSCEQVSEDADFTISKKSIHSRRGHSTQSNLGRDDKKLGKLHRKGNKFAVFGEQLHLPEIEIYTSKGKQKGRNNEPSYYANDNSDEKLYCGSADFEGESNRPRKLGKINQMHDDPSARPYSSFAKSYSENKGKQKVDLDYSSPHSSYKEEDDIHGTDNLVDGPVRTKKLGKKLRSVEQFEQHDDVNAPLVACNSLPKKRKGKADEPFLDNSEELSHLPKSQLVLEDTGSAKKKGKKKGGVGTVPIASMTPEVNSSEVQAGDTDQEARMQKKSFTLITPTVHTGFSFSIIHLLSAVRVAMFASTSEDIVEKVDIGQKLKLESVNGLVSSGDYLQATTDTAEQAGSTSLPSLTVQEIVERVKSNPGDPCILETQEPLQDLVRGVLRIFVSKTAPLGAKGWKALVSYEKVAKSWTWVGPVSSFSETDPIEEVTSASAWGIPHKMLVKLVDAFANWLKNGQETLQQIGSLPDPPVMFMPHMDEKERFRDLRAQKSLTTISPSSDEVRAYFRKEEYLRYMVPDRAFSYTAVDGKKSIVAPLRRCGGKPTSKARDHFMLKPDRPPHVTILCLVRDSASRLPSSIGTRADVCTLIRDSQYVVEDVSDAQVNQVVSGALDRLHYERDPCVQFDSERKLWVYLHRDREEEDFEDDGTSSTKKWKRPRKEAAEQNEPGPENDVAFQGRGDQVTGGSGGEYEVGPEFIPEPPVYEQGKVELVYNNLQPTMESLDPFIGSSDGGMRQGHPMGWEVLESNRLRESNMLCQENLTNEDFDDDGFGRERSVRVLSAGLI